MLVDGLAKRGFNLGQNLAYEPRGAAGKVAGQRCRERLGAGKDLLQVFTKPEGPGSSGFQRIELVGGQAGQVLTLEHPSTDECLQAPVRFGRAGDDEQARCVAIEPVDDARAIGFLSAFDGVREQPVHERACRVSGCGVDDDTGRLVDDEQVLVFVRKSQLHRLGHELAERRRGRFELDLLPACEPVALRTPLAVHADSAVLEQPLGRCARADLGCRREEAVEPLACGSVRNA